MLYQRLGLLDGKPLVGYLYLLFRRILFLAERLQNYYLEIHFVEKHSCFLFLNLLVVLRATGIVNHW